MESYETLQQALSGDDGAWDRVFDRLWPIVAGVAASHIFGMDYSAVEDCAQNTFARLLEKDSRRLREYDPHRGTIESYVAKIAYHCTIDFLRTHARHSRNINQIQITASQNDSEHFYPWELTAALETLTTREKEVMELLYFDHVDTGDIANRLGVTAETVRSVKSHAMQKLRVFFYC